jgi:hypothetical protein
LDAELAKSVQGHQSAMRVECHDMGEDPAGREGLSVLPNGRYRVRTTWSLGLRKIQSRSFGFSHLVLSTWTASSTVFGFSSVVSTAQKASMIAAKVVVLIETYYTTGS